MIFIHKTAENVEILVEKGKKSSNDFIVKYREPKKHLRTPKHIHLVVDILEKRTGNRTKTDDLLNHIIEKIIKKVEKADSFPPKLSIYSKEIADQFSSLNIYGEYSVEFILVVIELIMIQEKTNYPNGNMNLRLFQLIKNGGDIFSIVSAATFR